MTNPSQLKRKANELRKAGEYHQALPLYRDLWKQTGDEFDGAGLLQCLRKLEAYDEAIPLADELIDKYPEFDWVRNEAIWTYIQGVPGKLDQETPLQNIVDKSERIMKLKPQGIAAKIVVFRVLKSAKAANNWQVVNDWLDRLDPNLLSVSTTACNPGDPTSVTATYLFTYQIPLFGTATLTLDGVGVMRCGG